MFHILGVFEIFLSFLKYFQNASPPTVIDQFFLRHSKIEWEQKLAEFASKKKKINFRKFKKKEKKKKLLKNLFFFGSE